MNGVVPFIPHPSSLIPLDWPDSGLTRNTRAPGYRCSVPGLAGFTGATLCGARSLITCQKHFPLPISDSDWFPLIKINRQLQIGNLQ
jgi:hypothetical protein